MSEEIGDGGDGGGGGGGGGGGSSHRPIHNSKGSNSKKYEDLKDKVKNNQKHLHHWTHQMRGKIPSSREEEMLRQEMVQELGKC